MASDMKNVMTNPEYNLNYGPPMAVRDEPHRTLNTLAPLAESLEFEAETIGELTTITARDVAEFVEFEDVELVGSLVPLNRR